MNIVCYLLLAGMGSSAFLFGVVVDFLMRVRPSKELMRVSRITDSGMFAGPAFAAISSLFLVADLGVPERFFMAFLSPASVLTWGAWALFVFVAFAALALVLSPFASSLIGKAVESACQLLATASAIFVLLYSAMFLSAYPSVPLLNSATVPVLFVLSALSSGLALLVLVGCVRGRVRGVVGNARPLIHVEAVIVVLEMIALTVFLVVSASGDTGALDSVAALAFGARSAVFWVGAVLFGMIVPLVFDLLNSRRVNMWLAGIGSICVLAGAFCLRYAILASAVRYGLPFMLPVQFWL